MPALFRPVDTNVGVIAMGGSASVELCRMNVRTGVVTSSLLPSSWTIQVTDNLLKLINWTQENERDKPEFLRMLMAALDSSGKPTAFLNPSPVNAQGVVVVTLTSETPNDVVLLYVPRTDESGFLLASGGGGGEGTDAFARSQIALLTDVVSGKADRTELGGYATDAELSAVQAAVDGKASATHNHDGVYAPVGHGHSEYALVEHNHDTAYAAIDHNHDTAYAAKAHTHAEYATFVYVNDTFALEEHAHAEYLTADDLSATVYSAGDGLSLDAATKTFSTNGTVARLVNPPQSGDAGKGLVFNSAGKLDTAEFALAEDLAAVSAGIKYKDPVKRIVAALADIATTSGLANGDRVLVNAAPAVSSNGIYVKQAAAPGYVRADDFVIGDDASGSYVFVLDADGAGNAASYICNSAPGSDVIGTNSLSFVQYGVGKTYTAGSGLTLSGANQFSVTFGSANPQPNASTASAGSGTQAALANHVHPTDTTRAPLASPEFTGTPKVAASLATALTGKELVTAEWVIAKGYASGSSSVSDVTVTVVTPVTTPTAELVGGTLSGGVKPLVLNVGETAKTLAKGDDKRFNVKPAAGIAGAVAVVNSAGTDWTTIKGTAGQILKVSSAGFPEWGAAPSALPASTVKGQLLYTTDALGTWSGLSAGTAGQALLWDATDLVPKWTTLTAATVGAASTTGAGLTAPTRATDLATTVVDNELVTAKWVRTTVPYDIAGSCYGKLPQSTKVFLWPAPRAMKLDNTAATASFRVLTAGTSSATVLDVVKVASDGTATNIGTVTFAATSYTGTYAPAVLGAVITLAKDDYVYVSTRGPVDINIADLFFTMGGTVA